MLEIKDLHFRYSRRSPLVLNGVDLELPEGKIGILLGKNGSGKTTLFKNILGICDPDGGDIRFDGEDFLKLSRREKARKTLVRGLLYDLRNSDDFTLFSVAFHPGCGTARCLLRRDSAAFSAEEEDYAESRWTPTGRAWQAESEAALWQKLAEEGYTEVAWREETAE